MSKSKSNLQLALKQIAKSQTTNEKITALNHAFDVFSSETTRLEIAYEALKAQFRSVHLELEETNHRLQKKLIQLDTITHYLNSIITNISQGILFIDLSGYITTFNETAEHILDFKSENVLFNRFWDYFEDTFFGFSVKDALLNQQSPKSTYVERTTPQGNYRELEVHTKFILHALPPLDDNSLDTLECIQGILIIFRDITEIHYLQNLSNRNDRMKELGELAAMLAHEIRNPLGGIKGFASLLQRDLKEQPHLQQMTEFIIEGTDNLNNLVSQVLNYSRPFKANFVNTNILSILYDLQKHLRADKILESDITIEIKTKLKELSFPVDPLLFKTAILNLIVNAIQAMPEGGRIIIEVTKNQEMACIKIRDTGHGISKENLKKLFSPFFTTKPNGNGLGLCEAHKVVQAHAGRLEVFSEVNKGTQFIIELPLRAFAGK